MRTIQTSTITKTFPSSETERLWVYNGLDCCVTLEVLLAIEPQLDNVTRATYEFSKSLQAPVLEMNMRGTLIDQDRKAEAIRAFQEKITKLSADLNYILVEGLGVEINYRSHVQLKDLFYNRMGIPPVRKRNTKGELAPTVDREALEKLQTYFNAEIICSYLLILRDLEKKVSALKTEVDPDGRMRTSYNIGGTTTGRFSSSESIFGTGGNLQNLEEQLRAMYVADPGMKLAYVDLEQAESRLVGAIIYNTFGDSKYLDACEGGDLHTYVCRLTYPEKPWTGDLKKDKDLAEEPFYRQHSLRHMSKVLGHGCLTADHEVLTPSGWVSISEMPDTIMGWSSTGSFFTQPLSWSNYEYKEPLHSFEGNSISILMTADHRIPYIADQRRSQEIKFRSASMGPQAFMPLGGHFVGGYIEAPARLIAAFQADGYQHLYGVSFHFNKERKGIRLEQLCNEYGYEYARYINKDGSLKYNVKAWGWPKFPSAAMLRWTSKSLRDFVDELKYWDGSINKSQISLFSKHKETLEWYQTFARLCGIGGKIQKPTISGFGTTMYKLQQNNRQWANGSSVQHTIIPNEGIQVYCPTVETGCFYVRRNGRIFVTGNSNYLGTPPTMAKHTKFEVRAVREFQTKYFMAFPGIPKWHEHVRQTLRNEGRLTSLMGRRRSFFGRLTDETTVREAVAYDPQSSVAEILNTGLLNLWRVDIVQILMQIHDALLIQYPEADEDRIIPQVQSCLRVPVELRNNRQLIIPSDVQVGWNWSKRTAENPDGLIKFRGHDDRKRSPKASILDTIVYRV